MPQAGSLPLLSRGWFSIPLAVGLLAFPSEPVLLADSSRAGPEPESATLLVDAFETFLKDRDIEVYRRSLTAHYSETSLIQILRNSGPQARRAAVLALGLVGTMKANEAVGRALGDNDSLTRQFAQMALWDLWFRGGTVEQNATLKQISELNAASNYREAEKRATALIADAPTFSEAFNQRAIARFFLGHYTESAEDCRRVIELNPYHFGAMSGLGQCYLRMGRRAEALDVYRQALKIQPYSDTLREIIHSLESIDT